MEQLTNLVTNINKLNSKKEELKLWLSQKEVVEYYQWRNENEKDRTAMDKVVAQLKLNDEVWLEKEVEYSKTKVEYENLKRVYDVVLTLMSQGYGGEFIEKFVEGLV